MSQRFGQYVARKRKAAGLTQAELAGRVSVTTTYIRHLERGVDPFGRSESLRPAVELVDAIAKAVDAPLAETRSRAGYATPTESNGEELNESGFDKSDFAALYRKYERLKPKQKRAFTPILEMIDRELERLQKNV